MFENILSYGVFGFGVWSLVMFSDRFESPESCESRGRPVLRIH